MSAVISPCGTWRYRLDRDVQKKGKVFAYFGVNGSTAGPIENDHTVSKWIGFTERNGGRKFIVGNPFAYRAKDVSELSRVADPIGPENDHYLREIIAEADVLVPCWGSRMKLRKDLRPQLDRLRDMLEFSTKPILVFGFTAFGDPMHPLMLGYDTPLTPWDQLAVANRTTTT
jgi:hypothetical protein